MNDLPALLGGTPVRSTPFPVYRTIGAEEKQAVMAVLDSGVLSQFLGAWTPDFFGGPRVRELEADWCRDFAVAHAISVNSATSGLYAAVGAAGVGPGDEVIVSPYTMTASASAALVYGAVPVFADIDPETYCLTAETIRAKLSERTKAVIVVDIFGHPADFAPIMELASAHGLTVIEDCAQAPGALYHGKAAGTLAHMGVYSLNYHKTIHCGEGGIVVTDDPALAERLQLIRNHGEAVVKHMGYQGELSNLVGFNYRMTEIEAAIAREQLKKLPQLVARRQENAAYLSQGLQGLRGLSLPQVAAGCTHGWYVYPLKYSAAATGISRATYLAALRAEGVEIAAGYVEPLYLQPLYQQKIAYGKEHFPFSLRPEVSYERGLCPVTERMHFDELLYSPLVHADLGPAELDQVIAAFHKIDRHLDALRGIAA